jgi:predicted tellurium resistance membrane protein TerC
VLVFIGVKMAASTFVEVPVLVSLLVVAVLLGGSIVASIRKQRQPHPRPHVPA